MQIAQIGYNYFVIESKKILNYLLEKFTAINKNFKKWATGSDVMVYYTRNRRGLNHFWSRIIDTVYDI